MSTLKHSIKSAILVALACGLSFESNAQFIDNHYAYASIKSKSMTNYAMAQHDQDFVDMDELLAEINEGITREASYRGGTENLMAYIKDNYEYPDHARQNGIEGKILAQFNVEADGQIGDVTIIQSADASLDAELVRVIKSLPKWEPAMDNGTSTSTVVMLPFKASLK